MSLSYNIAITAFGGFTPITVTWLINQTGSPLMPAFYMLGIAIFSLMVVGATLRSARPTEQLATPGAG
jgi:MHS family proline/betaine transporter-like MFS transporter